MVAGQPPTIHELSQSAISKNYNQVERLKAGVVV